MFQELQKSFKHLKWFFIKGLFKIEKKSWCVDWRKKTERSLEIEKSAKVNDILIWGVYVWLLGPATHD